ncbi:MAG: isocitrate lyase/phosphoenolpyruvate mutase family protein [Actinoplanes sp.]
MAPQTRTLRDALAAGEVTRAFGAHDALSAAIASRAGFEAIWASGFGVSATLGLPDLSLASMSDQLAAAARMAAVCEAPVLADVDSGFGGRLNVAHTVEMYERAGVAGVCIEDKEFPKTNSFVPHRQQLLSAHESAVRVEVARQARRDEEFVVVARTEALICGQGVDEALRRAHEYVDAGADAILVHSQSPRPDQIVAFLRAWQHRAAVVVAPTTYYTWPAKEAGEAGVSMVIYANQGLRAAVRGVTDTVQEILRSGSSATVEPRIASLGDVFEATGLQAWLDRERDDR